MREKITKILVQNDKILKFLPSIFILILTLKSYVPILTSNSYAYKAAMMAAGAFSALMVLYHMIINKKINTGFVIVGGIVFLMSTATKNGEFLFSLLAVYALQNTDFDEYIRKYFKWNFMLFVLVLIFSFLGIKDTVMFKTTAINTLRNDLGFGNPNTAYLKFYVIWLSALYIIFRQKKASALVHASLIISPILMYIKTYTRTGLITIAATYLAALFFKHKSNLLSSTKAMVILATTPMLYLLATVTISSKHLFKNKALNYLLSYRPTIWNTLLHSSKMPLNLVGYDNEIIKIFSKAVNKKYSLDGSFAALLLKSGMIVAVLVVAVYIISICYYHQRREYMKVVMILSVLTYGFMETILTDVTLNLTLFLIFDALFVSIRIARESTSETAEKRE